MLPNSDTPRQFFLGGAKVCDLLGIQFSVDLNEILVIIFRFLITKTVALIEKWKGKY